MNRFKLGLRDRTLQIDAWLTSGSTGVTPVCSKRLTVTARFMASGPRRPFATRCSKVVDHLDDIVGRMLHVDQQPVGTRTSEDFRRDEDRYYWITGRR